MSSRFPDKGILWRVWNDDTRREIEQRACPVLLFVLDRTPAVWPWLKQIFEDMPADARLRELLRKPYVGLLIEADAIPEELKALGAGSRYHIAVLSPYGLTPMVIIDPTSGTPADVIGRIVAVLERLIGVWGVEQQR